MKVVGVTTLLNEEDIIGYTIDHLLLEGVDQIYAVHGPSTDETEAILRTYRDVVTIIHDDAPIHYQPKWMTYASRQAYAEGADWIIPFDADEFWVAKSGARIREVMQFQPEHVGQLGAPMVRMFDWDLRIDIGTLGKAAFRAGPNVVLANGNHGVAGAVGVQEYDVLQIREICYRNFEHFKRKTRERNATIDPSLAPGEGAHQRRYAGMDDDQLRREWDEYCALPMTHDPIPTRLVRPHQPKP